MDLTKVQIKQLEGKSNWLNWKGRVSILLRGTTDALDVVEGKLKKPDEPAEGATEAQQATYLKAYNKYQKADSSAMIIMSTNMSEETYEKVRSLTCAREVWLELHRLFDGVHEDKAYDLCMQFFNYKMNQTDDIATHIGKLKNVWKELKVELDKDENNNLLLMCRIVETLPSEYFSFASSWRLLNKAERTVDNLTDQLCSYERALASKTEPVQHEALFAKSSYSKSAQKSNKQTKCSKPAKQGNVVCHYCKREGHIVRKCEKWIADGKPPKPVKSQYHSPGSAHSVSMLAMHSEAFAADGSMSSDHWFVDNGATCHLTFRRDILSDYKQFMEAKSLQVADGNRIEAVGTGTAHLKAVVSGQQHDVELNNVWYVPKLNRNLFSVLAAQDKVENSLFISTSTICNLNIDDKKVLVGARDQKGGLFRLVARTVLPAATTSVLNMVSDEDTLQLYHERLGHKNKRHVVKVIERALGVKVPVNNDTCEGCQYGKAHRLKFGTRRITTTAPGQLMHADICGPIEVKSARGYRYFVLFKDDFSKYRQVYFMKEKCEVAAKLKQMLAETTTLGHTVKELISDNGLEFNNEAVRQVLQRYGIHQRLVTPYTPQQNGSAERENRTIVEAARTLLHAHVDYPKTLWAEMVNTATYILNRTGVSSVDLKSPHEVWFERKPEIKHLRVIGTTCYAHVPDQRRRKLDKKSVKCTLIGYDGDDGYRVWNEETATVIRSRDVTFEKEISFRSKTCTDTITELEQPNSNEKEEIPEHVNDDEQNVEEEVISQKNAEPVQEDRRSLRNRITLCKPARFDDFVMLASDMMNSAEPESYDDAIKSKNHHDWKEAMQSEMKSHQENQTWDLVDLPEGKKAIPCKWVFKVKTQSDGSVERYKARLVIKGCAQKKGIDYDQTFSPVVRNTTIRTLLSVAASEKLHLMQFDVSTAFLYGNLQEEIYMKQPEGFTDGTAKVCKLKRSLYGLKQAPRCWNARFGAFLGKWGFRQSNADPCLYIQEKGTSKLLLALYVDDGIVAATDKGELSEFAENLKSEFKIVTKPATYFLGIEIDQKSDGSIKISQAAYTRKILEQFSMSECRPCATPIISSEKAETDDNEPVKFPYRSAVGALLYLMTGTRPDIAYAVSVVSRNLENPTKSDVTQVKRILRYLKGTSDTGIVYRPQQKATLLCYSDADHAGDKTTGRSTTGVVCIYAEGAISWLSQRQASVAISTTEAELVAASEAAREILWLKRLLSDVVKFNDIPQLQVDNEAAVKLAQNPELHRRTKHIRTRHFFVRELVTTGEIDIARVSSEAQLADILTKPMHRPRLQSLVKEMGLQ